MADTGIARYPSACRDHGPGYEGTHGLGCDCPPCICGPEACDDGGDGDEVEWCAYCAALDPDLPCPAAPGTDRLVTRSTGVDA